MNESDNSTVLIREENHLGRITLNRPRQINALTLEMVLRVRAALSEWVDDPQVRLVLIDGAGDRGLCAGADIRSLYEALADTAVDPARFLADEYVMNSMLAHYPKPVVAYQSGLTLGGGVGISGHCSVRVVTETAQLGMPETAIGLVPDVGGLYLLSRSPGELGTYAALTGARLGPGDAIVAGLSDAYVPASELDSLTDQLRAGDLPSVLGQVPPPGELAAQRGWIDSCFAGNDVEGILQRLLAHPDPAAGAAAEKLAAMSPTALKVTLLATRRAASLTLDEVLDQDLRVCSRFLRHHDLTEGIRAMIIDKDRRPRWEPARLEDVSEADVAAFFESLGT